MKSKFSDPVAVRENKAGNMPWSFKAPEYDKRSGSFVSAGSDYGVGHLQPVGREGSPKEKAATMPMTSKMVRTDEVD